MHDEAIVSSNTGQEQVPERKPGTFAKGDSRINRKGRPRSFDALRRLTLAISCEIIESEDKASAMSRVERIMRDWATSKDPAERKAFIEYAYGKVPQPSELSGANGSDFTIRVVYGKDGTHDTPA